MIRYRGQIGGDIMTELIIDQLDEHIKNLENLKDWLGVIYLTGTFVSFLHKPVLSILSSACVHLIDNLKIIRARSLEE